MSEERFPPDLSREEVSFLFHRVRERQVEATENGAKPGDSAYDFREGLMWELWYWKTWLEAKEQVSARPE